MRILIADDDDVSRLAVEAMLIKRGHEVVAVADGAEAWQALQEPDAPRLVLLDWMMPEMDGLEVCRRLRQSPLGAATYVILLTAQASKDSLVTGLDAGADDYITKPFDREELRARVQVGRRILELQRNLADQVAELEKALAEVKQLSGLLPICCYCKKIRDDKNYWQQLENYIGQRSGARFSHGICPDCWQTEVVPQLGPPSPTPA